MRSVKTGIPKDTSYFTLPISYLSAAAITDPMYCVSPIFSSVKLSEAEALHFIYTIIFKT